ncbi:hypothetical protein FRC20_004534, partial [Serendipita sp. 405]
MATMTTTMTTTSTEPTLRSRASSRSLKRAFKSPFGKSSSSQVPDLPDLPLPSTKTPAISTTVTMQKSSSSAKDSKSAEKSTSKKSKQTKPEKAKEAAADVRYYADGNKTGSHRPVTYATAVQLNMLMGGGTQEYWLAQARQTGGEADEEGGGGIGNGVAEVGGFVDDSGQIWWDMQEKAEWTSLLPKDAQGLPVQQTDEMWVEFDNDGRRNSTSSDESSSFLSAEFAEEVDGPMMMYYGDYTDVERSAVYGIQKATGPVLFPIIDINNDDDHYSSPNSPDSAMARSIISQAHKQIVYNNKSTIVLGGGDGFDDSFLSYETEINTKTISSRPEAQ